MSAPWKPNGDGGWTLQVLDHSCVVTFRVAYDRFHWWTSDNEWGLSETELDAKEQAVFHLRLTLDEQIIAAKAALDELDRLELETPADRAVFTRGLRRRNGT